MEAKKQEVAFFLSEFDRFIDFVGATVVSGNWEAFFGDVRANF